MKTTLPNHSLRRFVPRFSPALARLALVLSLLLPAAAWAQSDATLTNLAISAGTVTPTFASNILNYAASVSYPTTTLTITPLANDPSASVAVNGSAVTYGQSVTNNLSVGTNVISTVVVSQDTTATNTYTLIVTRAGRLWDGGTTNITASGDGTSGGGAGTWDTTIQNWDQGAGLPHMAWSNANNETAVFGGTAGTVTLGTGITVGGLEFDNGNYTITGNTLTFGAAGSINNVVAGGNNTVGSVLAGSAAIATTGAGTLTIKGSAVNTFNGGLALNGGTLLADFSNLGTPTDLINNANPLTLGGGILSVKGKSSGATSQTLAGVTVSAGGGQILGNKNSGASTTINLGALTATASGGSLLVGNATTTAGNAPVITTASNTNGAANNIYGGRVVFFSGTANTGYDWATTTSGSSPYTFSAYSGYTALPTSGGDPTVNYLLNNVATTTLAGSVSVNSLKFYWNGANTLALGANLLTIGSGGLLITGGIANNGATISGTAGGTRLTADSGSGYDLIIHQFATGGGNGLTISAVIGDNISGSVTNPVTLVKTGSAYLNVSGANTYSGSTYVNAGILDLGNIGMTTFGGNQRNIYIAPGAILKRGTFNSAFYNRLVPTTAEVGLFCGTATANVDFSATGANLPNAFFGNWAGNGAKFDYTGIITPANNTYRLGFPGSSGCLGIGSSTFFLTGSNRLIIGGGTVDLVGTGHTFTGDTVIRTGGHLLLGNNLALQNSPLNLGTGSDSITGVFGCSAHQSTSSAGDVASSSPTIGGLKGSRNLLTAYSNSGYGNNTTLYAATSVTGFTLNVGAGQTCTYSGAIANFAAGTTLTLTGAGTQVLSGINTYSGATTISAGTLNLTGQLTGGGAVTVADNATLNVSGQYTSAAIAGPGDLTLGTCSLGFDSLFSTNVAPVNANNVVANGTVTINFGSNLIVGELPLIKYATALSGAGTFVLGSLPAGVSATLVTNTLNQSLDLNVTAAPPAPVSIITDLPATTTYRFAGTSYSLSVVAVGTPPLTYLWSHNGTPVGSNSPTLTLTGLAPGDSGSYNVTITNAANSVPSAINQLVVLTPSTDEGLVLASGPTAFWPLNEASGPTAFDYVTYSTYNGAYSSGGVSYSVAGPASDSVVSLDGVSGNVTVPYSPALNPSGPFSVEAWLNPSSVSASLVCALSDNHAASPRSGWLIYVSTAGWEFRTYNQNTTATAVDITGGTPTAGVWNHVAAVWDGSQGYLYVNGVLTNTSPVTNFVANVDAPFTVGCRSDLSFFWGGSVGGVALYSRALSSTEVAQHALNPPPQPVLNYTWLGGVLTLNWTSGTLQAAPEATGTYTNVPSAVSPYPVPLTQPRGFYRLSN